MGPAAPAAVMTPVCGGWVLPGLAATGAAVVPCMANAASTAASNRDDTLLDVMLSTLEGVTCVEQA